MSSRYRRSLSRSMRLRRVPELRFKYDDSVDKGERIESLLRQQARDLGVDQADGAAKDDGED